jgi:hypothetical protein
MPARTYLIATLLMLLCALAGPAQAQGRRVALVVGNSGYQNVDRLTNPANDARLIAETLRQAGFTLVGDGPQLDLDKARFDRDVQTFGNALQGADVAVFYYSGHGMQVNGVNWLVPVDARPTGPRDLDFQMVDAGLVLKQMEGAGTKLNLLILDACRNNPFAVRGVRGSAPGLAEMHAPEGTLISYATQPGNVAADGDTQDSPYTQALAAAMRKPGADVFQVFNQVGLQVKQLTGGQQQPWLASSPIAGNFFFFGPVTLSMPGTEPQPNAAPPPINEDALYWQSIASSRDPEDFRSYLANFPQGRYADLARRRIAALGALASVPRMPDAGTPDPRRGDADWCSYPYVWREATPQDHVCVLPAIRTRSAQENTQAGRRVNRYDHSYGPDTCEGGFVWREATPTDHVCVTPDVRDETWQDNAAAADRLANKPR